MSHQRDHGAFWSFPAFNSLRSVYRTSPARSLDRPSIAREPPMSDGSGGSPTGRGPASYRCPARQCGSEKERGPTLASPPQYSLAASDDEGIVLQDRKRVVSGKSVSVRLDHGGVRIIKKNRRTTQEKRVGNKQYIET